MSQFPKQLHKSDLKCSGPGGCPDCRYRQQNNKWDDFWISEQDTTLLPISNRKLLEILDENDVPLSKSDRDFIEARIKYEEDREE